MEVDGWTLLEAAATARAGDARDAADVGDADPAGRVGP